MDAIATPRIKAVLHFALLVEVIEGPVAERGDHDDGNDGDKIAAPARMRLLILTAG